MSNIHRHDEKEQEDVKGFDFRTHLLDKKSKTLSQVQCYRLCQVKGGQTIIERPPYSNRFYTPDGAELNQSSVPKELFSEKPKQKNIVSKQIEEEQGE